MLPLASPREGARQVNLYLTPAERQAQASRDPVERTRELLRDYQSVFASDAGQRVLLDLLRRTGVMLSTYDPKDTTPAAMQHREGQRAVGLYLVRQLNAHPDAALRLAATGNTAALFPDP